MHDFCSWPWYWHQDWLHATALFIGSFWRLCLAVLASKANGFLHTVHVGPALPAFQREVSTFANMARNYCCYGGPHLNSRPLRPVLSFTYTSLQQIRCLYTTPHANSHYFMMRLTYGCYWFFLHRWSGINSYLNCSSIVISLLVWRRRTFSCLPGFIQFGKAFLR